MAMTLNPGSAHHSKLPSVHRASQAPQSRTIQQTLTEATSDSSSDELCSSGSRSYTSYSGTSMALPYGIATKPEVQHNPAEIRSNLPQDELQTSDAQGYTSRSGVSMAPPYFHRGPFKEVRVAGSPSLQEATTDPKLSSKGLEDKDNGSEAFFPNEYIRETAEKIEGSAHDMGISLQQSMDVYFFGDDAATASKAELSERAQLVATTFPNVWARKSGKLKQVATLLSLDAQYAQQNFASQPIALME